MLITQFKYALVDAVILRVKHVYENSEEVINQILNTEINTTEQELLDLWDEYIDIENLEGDPSGASFKAFVQKVWS